MWYVRLIDEFKECLEFFDFVWNWSFSSDSEAEFEKSNVRSGIESGVLDATESLQGPSIDWIHRGVVAGTTLMRFWLVVYLANIGTVYHLSTHTCIDLLLNAIALAFILELPEFIYSFLLPDDAKKEAATLEPFSFSTSMPTGFIMSRIASKPFVGLFIIPVIALFVVVYNDMYRTQPALEALQCTCLLRGERCNHPGRFSKTWWDGHWGEVHGLTGLDQLPQQGLLDESPVTAKQEAFSPSPLSPGVTQRLGQDALSPARPFDANSTAQVDAADISDFLLQTDERQHLAMPASVRLESGVTLSAVEQHVANATGLLQVEHVRDQALKRVHDVIEL